MESAPGIAEVDENSVSFRGEDQSRVAGVDVEVIDADFSRVIITARHKDREGPKEFGSFDPGEWKYPPERRSLGDPPKLKICPVAAVKRHPTGDCLPPSMHVSVRCAV